MDKSQYDKDETLLCQKPKTTDKKCRTMIEAGDTEGLVEFIKGRFTERYITPLKAVPKSQANGFSTMAICCLMIEALESFRQGWEDTDRKGALPFCCFFSANDNFAAFRTLSVDFYRQVRCGILHQGETTKGWRIKRWKHPLLDPTTKTINADKFHLELAISLEQYCDALSTCPWGSDLWVKFERKMRKVLKNCNP
ncbi:MAG: hypothetical protein ACRD9S_19280 [Pyrinomonadaceae bacterium]